MSQKTRTFVGLVTDKTPESLGYGNYRGYVEIDELGEWLRDLSNSEVSIMVLGDPVYSTEYENLRPVAEAWGYNLHP